MLLSRTCLVLETLVNCHGWNCSGPIGSVFSPLEEKLQVEIYFERLGWIFLVVQDFVFEDIPLDYYFQLPTAILFLSFRQAFSSSSWLPVMKKIGKCNLFMYSSQDSWTVNLPRSSVSFGFREPWNFSCSA